MDVVIRFIGLVLFYQATAGSPQHALIPKWEKGDEFCAFRIPKHQPYIRIPKDRVVREGTTWTKTRDCKRTLNCEVYEIPVGSTLSIHPGFASTATRHEEVPCLVPDFRSEKLVVDPSLHEDALTTRSAVDWVLPAGHLSAHQFANDQIYTQLVIPAPSRQRGGPITITAAPRDGSTPRTLVVEPGTPVDILNVPPAHATVSYHLVRDHHPTNESLKGHFFFLHKLLVDHPNTKENCQFINDTAPETCFSVLRNNLYAGQNKQTLDIGCGSGKVGPKTQ